MNLKYNNLYLNMIVTFVPAPSCFRFLLAYQVFHPLISTGIVPLLLLSFTNIRIFFRLGRKLVLSTLSPFMCRFNESRLRPRAKKDTRTSQIVTAIVTIFLILNTPRLLLGIFEIFRQSTQCGSLIITQYWHELCHCTSLMQGIGNQQTQRHLFLSYFQFWVHFSLSPAQTTLLELWLRSALEVSIPLLLLLCKYNFNVTSKAEILNVT